MLLAIALAAAIIGSGQIDQLTGDLSLNKSVKVKQGVLAKDTGLGGAETILLVGNDTRSGQSAYKDYQGVVPSLANESLLIRLDPTKHWISMLSIPRELMTTIHCPGSIGTVVTRFNYSLACGGFTTLVSTIKQVTGLSVNHVVEIDFQNFEKAVNDLGCVYYQVDQRYYHVNVPGGQQYQQINLEPGYEKLCGVAAEQFVSFRHSDTSLVRDARDQTFLEAARQQYAGSLISHIGKYEKIFGELIQADAALKTRQGILDLISTAVETAGYPIRQVQVGHIDYSPTDPNAVSCNCITAPASALHAAAYSFLYGKYKAPPKKQENALAKKDRRKRAALALVPNSSTAASLAARLQAKVPFRVEMPTTAIGLGQNVPGMYFRSYLIHGTNGKAYPAFVQVYPVGLLGQFYDVEGTTWTGAPAVASADQSVKVGGVTYYLDYTGAHIDQVSWYQNNAVYWLKNSLTDGVGNGQMLALAEQTQAVGGTIPAPAKGDTFAPKSVARPVIAAKQASSNTAGRIAGIVGLVLVLLLGGACGRNRWRLAKMRRRRADLADRIMRLEAVISQTEVRTRAPRGSASGPPPAATPAAARPPARRPR